MPSYFVFSTLSNSNIYTAHEKGPADLPIETGRVFIKGGAGVANKHLITPLGVMTEVDENQMTLLNNNSSFLEHKKRGFITVQSKAHDIEKVVTEMERRDNSAPVIPEDYVGAPDGVAKPSKKNQRN